MFQKTIKFLKLTKQQAKRNLLTSLPSLLIELAFFIELAFQNFFQKIKYIYNSYSSFGVLIFTVDIHFE